MKNTKNTMSNKTRKTEKENVKSAPKSERQWYAPDDVYIFVDQNLRLIPYSLYAVGAVGLLLVARSLHVHRKFGNISDIPIKFLSKGVPFRGRVEVLDTNHVLHVDHVPIMTSRFVPFRNRDELLPVALAGIHVSPVGSKWLADNVLGRMVKVTPLTISGGVLEGVVLLEKRVFHKSLCVNKSLVEQGLCKVSYPDPLPTSTSYLNLLDDLIKLEAKADKTGKGLWKAAADQRQKHNGSPLKRLWQWLKARFWRKMS